MKKTFIAIVMAITMVISVMGIGAEKAFAATYSNDAVVANDADYYVCRVNDDFKSIVRYIEANPNWDFHLVKMMIHHEGDDIIVSTAWMTDDEMNYETYRYGTDEVADLDMQAAVIDGYYLCHYWLV